MKKTACLFMLINCLVFGLLLAPEAIALNSQSPGSRGELLQFTAGGYVLGFGSGEMYLAGGDHLLRVEYVGANPGLPVTETPLQSAEDGGNRDIAPLDRVTYQDVWDGVNLVYEHHSQGLVKTTYYLAPGRDKHKHIRLKYNVPVNETAGGGLSFTMGQGVFLESGPIAWQEIKGRRVPVEVAFRVLGEREAGFRVGAHDPAYPLVIDPVLTWHTFMGSAASLDSAKAIAVDGSGNVYVAGDSPATWGAPVNGYTGGMDAFAAKLDPNGNRLWNTFMGSNLTDFGNGITVDDSGNVYVTGVSESTWGVPIVGPTGEGQEAFVAKLDPDGNLLWNTFWGTAIREEAAFGIALDGAGNIYFAGISSPGVGAPNSSPRGDTSAYGSDEASDLQVNPHAGGSDGFVVKLNPNGTMLWDTYMGSATMDSATSLSVDGDGNVFVAGWSNNTWGTPVNPFAGGTDGFAAMLDTNGNRLWNTFMGSAVYDVCNAIAVDDNDDLYLAGNSNATWGAPVNPYAGGVNDAFAAKLDGDGNLTWNTFMGSSNTDIGAGIATDGCGNVFVTGESYATWGAPTRPFAGSTDAFAAELDSNGNLFYNTFLGGVGDDFGNAIAVNQRNLYVSGTSQDWGTPVNPHAGNYDAFAAQLAIEMPQFSILTVVKQGGGMGLVTSSPEGIDCGEICEADFCLGDTVTLTATAVEGSFFVGWSGGGCTGMAPCTLTLDSDRLLDGDVSVTALFVDPSSPGCSGCGSCFIEALGDEAEGTEEGSE